MLADVISILALPTRTEDHGRPPSATDATWRPRAIEAMCRLAAAKAGSRGDWTRLESPIRTAHPATRIEDARSLNPAPRVEYNICREQVGRLSLKNAGSFRNSNNCGGAVAGSFQQPKQSVTKFSLTVDDQDIVVARTVRAELAWFRNSSLTSAQIGIGRHTGPLARTNVAKHRDYCMRIERSRLFEAVFLLEPHKGLPRLRTDHTVERTVVKTECRSSSCASLMPSFDRFATVCGC